MITLVRWRWWQTVAVQQRPLLLQIPHCLCSHAPILKSCIRMRPHIKINLELAVRSRQLARRMNFKWLRPDEVIYFLARKHSIVLWEKLTLPLMILILPLALFYIRIFYVPLVIFPLVGGLLLFLLLIWIFWLWIDWGNDYYIVTNQRVVWLEKVVGIYDSRQESPIGTILSVGVEVFQDRKDIGLW